jgi:hypothetical protein
MKNRLVGVMEYRSTGVMDLPVTPLLRHSNPVAAELLS